MKTVFGNGRVRDIFFCRHQLLGSVHAYSETRSRSTVWKEYTHDKGQKHGIELIFPPQIVGFMHFVWPCLDDSDDIRDLQWCVNLEKIVDCCPMRVVEWSNRPRYSCFCIRSSARVCFWQATNCYRLCSSGITEDFVFVFCLFCFTFPLLNQEDTCPCILTRLYVTKQAEANQLS